MRLDRSPRDSGSMCSIFAGAGVAIAGEEGEDGEGWVDLDGVEWSGTERPGERVSLQSRYIPYAAPYTDTVPLLQIHPAPPRLRNPPRRKASNGLTTTVSNGLTTIRRTNVWRDSAWPVEGEKGHLCACRRRRWFPQTMQGRRLTKGQKGQQ